MAFEWTNFPVSQDELNKADEINEVIDNTNWLDTNMECQANDADDTHDGTYLGTEDSVDSDDSGYRNDDGTYRSSDEGIYRSSDDNEDSHDSEESGDDSGYDGDDSVDGSYDNYDGFCSGEVSVG